MWAGASVRASAHLAVGVRGWVLSFVIYREDISRDTADYFYSGNERSTYYQAWIAMFISAGRII